MDDQATVNSIRDALDDFGGHLPVVAMMVDADSDEERFYAVSVTDRTRNQRGNIYAVIELGDRVDI